VPKSLNIGDALGWRWSALWLLRLLGSIKALLRGSVKALAPERSLAVKALRLY
jgi:hypothetical protein